MNILKREIHSILESWLGVKFVYRGYTKNGCDCAGLLVGVLNEMKIKKDMIVPYLDHKAGNGRYIDSSMILSTLRKFTKEIDIKNIDFLIEGDIILFSSNKKNCLPSHMGIVFSKQPVYFIHAHASVGRVVKNVLDNFWLQRLKNAFRLV